MNKIPNRKVICDILMAAAEKDDRVAVLCSDSRGSASLTPFAEVYPKRFVETGIAEQDLVGIAAGMARCGLKPYAAVPACFLSTRSYEQVKVDCAYSNMNVKLIGISGGVSYGSLGMSHHSAQDFAAMTAIPNMRVYCPSDRHQTRKLMEALLLDKSPAYIRVGRNPVEDIYNENDCPFALDKATVLRFGADITLIACGEMVYPALRAADTLKEDGIEVTLLDIHAIKPLDEEAVIDAARKTKAVITVEEHSPYGGLGARVAQIVSVYCPKRVVNLALPDAPVVAGTSNQVFDYYGLNTGGIVNTVKSLLRQ
jgi:transketolase